MRNMGKLKVTTPSEHEIVMTRDFNAPRSLVFDCWTKPELVRRWLLGPGRLVDAGLPDRFAGGRRLPV